MNKYLVEFIGSFFLVATIGFAVLKPGDAGAMAPLAIGSILMVMIFAGGYVSGAHYNPAVTLAVFLRGRCAASDVVAYMISQVVGALAAAAIVLIVKRGADGFVAPTAMELKILPALVVEFLYTFALCYVVLHVATAKGTTGNPTYGLAIGFTVLAGAYAVGGISGGAFNPAVAIGITVMGLSKLVNIWIFLVANFAAGAAAAAVFKIINPEDR